MPYANNVARMSANQIHLGLEVISGLTIDVTHDQNGIDMKLNALRKAILMIIGRIDGAFNNMPVLPVYLGNDLSNEVCFELGTPITLFLGNRVSGSNNLTIEPTTIKEKLFGKRDFAAENLGAPGVRLGIRGVADQAYDDKRLRVFNPVRWYLREGEYARSKYFNKEVAIVIHEFGHLLHQRRSSLLHQQNQGIRNLFSDHARPGDHLAQEARAVPFDLAVQVSQYVLGSNYLEFVAEVFTGRIVLGKTYSQAVNARYEQMQGPVIH